MRRSLLLAEEFLVLLVNSNEYNSLRKDCEDNNQEDFDNGKFCRHEFLLERGEEDEERDDAEYGHKGADDLF